MTLNDLILQAIKDGPGVKIERAQEVFKQFMHPFMKEQGFVRHKTYEKRSRCYHYKEKPEAHVCFGFPPVMAGSPIQIIDCTVGVDLPGGAWDHGDLSCMIDGIERYRETFRYPSWGFDNEVELVGALEAMANLIKREAIPWILGDNHPEINLRQKAAQEWQRRVEFYGEEGAIEKNGEEGAPWQAQRYYPKEWHLESEPKREG